VVDDRALWFTIGVLFGAGAAFAAATYVVVVLYAFAG